MQPKEYLSILLRHKVLVSVSTLSVLLSTIIFVYNIDDVYESYSTVVVDQRTQIVNGVLSSTAQPLSYFEGILDSRTFLEMAVDSIGLDVFKSVSKIMTREEAMVFLQENITLRETKYTSFLRFNCKSGNARLSYLMVPMLKQKSRAMPFLKLKIRSGSFGKNSNNPNTISGHSKIVRAILPKG